MWNNGWAYGARKLPHERALLIATASGSQEAYRKRGYDEAMRTQLVVGIMEYCGIPNSELRILFDVDEGDEKRLAHLATVRTLAAGYFGT